MSLDYQYSKKATDGLKVAKRFQADPKSIRIIDGFNYRALSPEHVQLFADAYANGKENLPPPIVVALGDDGVLELVDGEHRLRGALLAGVATVDLQEFKGTREERRAAAMRFNQGRKASATERAKAYKAQQVENSWTIAEIARQCAVSEGEVANHLLLAGCGDEVLRRIEAGEVKATPVITLARKISPENVLDYLEKKAQEKPASKKLKGKDLDTPPSPSNDRVSGISPDSNAVVNTFSVVAALLDCIEVVSPFDDATEGSVSLTLRCNAVDWRRLQDVKEVINQKISGQP